MSVSNPRGHWTAVVNRYGPQKRFTNATPFVHRFFSQTKYASFQRQLNLYGFSRLQHGPDKGAYFHLCFVRGQREKVRDMVRRKIKGTKVRRTMKPEEEPNFYDPKWNSKGTSKKTSTKGSARELGTKSLSLHEAVINSVKNKPESHFSESKVVSPPTIPEKVGHAPSSVPTTWDAFDEVKDNDFFFLDGSNFFDDELLDMSLLPSDRHANDSGNCFSFDPVARGLKKTASAVSMDQLCNTTA